MMTSDRDAPLRVAMVIHGYSQIGGAERQLMGLAPVLQNHGIAVEVITRRFHGQASTERIAGVSVHRLAAPGSRATSSIGFTLAAMRRMVRLRPHLIHAHDVYSPATAALLAKRVLRTPVVVKVPRGGSLGSIARLASRAFGRHRVAWLRRDVDTFVAINREIDGELAAIGVPAERRVSIPNGVDTDRFAPLSKGEKVRRRTKLGLPLAPVAIFTGRLAPEKRLRDLLAVWPEVRSRHAGARLLLVGSGDQQTALEEAAGEGVGFTGSVLDVAPYLQAADLFVLPSAAEGLSNSLLEAMATGLPCVATAVGGASDLIDHGRNGWLIPPGRRDLLRQAILALLDDPELRARMGKEARLRVESRYSLSRIAMEMTDMYRRLIACMAPSVTPGDQLVHR